MPKPEEMYRCLRDNKVALAIACAVLAALLIMAICLALFLPADAEGTVSPDVTGRYSNRAGCSSLPRMLRDPRIWLCK